MRELEYGNIDPDTDIDADPETSSG